VIGRRMWGVIDGSGGGPPLGLGGSWGVGGGRRSGWGGGASRDGERTVGEPEVSLRKVKEGYVGKPKGLKQVLWERGWWVEGMSMSDKVKPENNMSTVLRNLPEFQGEKTALQHTIESPRPHLDHVSQVPAGSGWGWD